MTTSLLRRIVLSLTVFATPILGPQTATAALEAAAASPTSVTLSWTAPGDDGDSGTASEYDVRYSLAPLTVDNWNAATQASGEPAPSVAGSAEQFEVTGLSPSTTYYFALRTGDEIPNWSPLSNVITKATGLETVAPGAIASLATDSPTPTSLNLTWIAPGDDGSVGTATTYDIRYATAQITDANWDGATAVGGEPSPSVAGTAESFVVTNLAPSTTYYFAIKTADEVPNWSPLSNSPSGSTAGEVTPPTAIANLGVGSPGETSVELNWTAPGDDGNSGTATEYDIRYSTANITAANFASAATVASPPAPLAAGSFQAFTVTGLNSATTYYFAVKTADEIPNWSTISNVVSISTGADATAPEDIAGLAVVLPAPQALTLVWTAPGDDGAVGQASQYEIRYSTSAINAGNWSSATLIASLPAPQSAGAPESLLVSGLVEETTYYFAIMAADEVPNWSGLSNVASNTTLPDVSPPAAVDDLTAIPGENDGEINLTWSAPGNDGLFGRAEAYELRYSLNPMTAADWAAAELYVDVPPPAAVGQPESCLLASLIPGETYYIGLKTYDDSANASFLSNVVSCEAGVDLILANPDLAQPSYPPPMAVLPVAQPVLHATNANASPDNQYRFELATDTNFVGLVASATVDQKSGDKTDWKITVPLEANQLYYWRVATNEVGFSAISSFSVEPFAHAYPNPLRLAETAAATFTDLPAGADLRLTSISGELVRHWTDLTGEDITWDATNDSGARVSSGTYLWFTTGGQSKGKLVVIN